MIYMKRHIISLLTVLAMAAAALYSCSPVEMDFNLEPEKGRSDDDIVRIQVKEYKNVFLVYSMGFNDLRSYLKEDIEDLLSNPLMDNRRDVLLIFSHLANHYPDERYPRFSEPTSPILTKVYRNNNGQIQKDTLLVMPTTTIAADKSTLNYILEYTKENFPAETYGILLSSHGSGWVPAGYLNNPNKFDPQSYAGETPLGARLQKQATPSYNMGREGDIDVKSMGVHNITTSELLEMDITDIADSFPFKMDYIIFDACFMGGIEVAYELRNVTDRIMFSQAEILADGMDYKSISSYIFAENGPDLEGFCQRYYDHYNSLSGQSKSATISLIDCSKLEALARTTGEMIEKYRSGLETLQNEKRSTVQRYYQSRYQEEHQWFYDFGDIIEKCGLTEEDKQIFNESLSAAVKYKAATPWFLSDFAINKHSGLSMYLPFTQKRDYLNNFYKTLEWNQAVGLVQ